MARRLSDIQVDATDSVQLGRFVAAVMSYCADAIEAAAQGDVSVAGVRTVLLENSAQRYAGAVMRIVVSRVQTAPADLTDAQIQQAVVRLMPKLLG
jgi:hypothetical protein